MADTVTQPDRRRSGTVLGFAGRLDDYHRPFALATVLLSIGVLAGLFGPAVVPAEDVLPEIAAGLPDLTVPGIFLNNLVVLGILVAGVLTLGVSSALVLVANGVVLGYVAAVIAAEEGLLVVFLGVVPHGVFEFPAFLVGGAVAFEFSRRAVARLRGRRGRIATRREYRDAALLTLAAVGLLLVAAVVEVHVTGRLVEVLTGG